ncbi:hypothetical protein SKAU_G00375060 [Synaphobranchus kaupii]|uniref:Uncharacterized protein n=1 Tax=Synaphobranchus kaupii TaxID=118154 RepID=A0A9Q1EGW2_SYNKA|nr:hypothetical protein SKAU_G00375060 [Synaphobranchus kaupii]
MVQRCRHLLGVKLAGALPEPISLSSLNSVKPPQPPSGGPRPPRCRGRARPGAATPCRAPFALRCAPAVSPTALDEAGASGVGALQTVASACITTLRSSAHKSLSEVITSFYIFRGMKWRASGRVGAVRMQSAEKMINWRALAERVWAQVKATHARAPRGYVTRSTGSRSSQPHRASRAAPKNNTAHLVYTHQAPPPLSSRWADPRHAVGHGVGTPVWPMFLRDTARPSSPTKPKEV